MQIIQRSLITFNYSASNKISPIFLNYYSKQWFKYGILESNIINSKPIKQEYQQYLLQGTESPLKIKLNDGLQTLLTNIDSIKNYQNRPLKGLSNQLIKPIEQYETIADTLIEIMNDMQTQDHSCIAEDLLFISKLMLNLNILNPAIWALFFQTLYKNIDYFVEDLLNNNTKYLENILRNINRHFKTFRQENWGVSYKQLILKEQELTSIIKSQQILGICVSISKQCDGDVLFLIIAYSYRNIIQNRFFECFTKQQSQFNNLKGLVIYKLPHYSKHYRALYLRQLKIAKPWIKDCQYKYMRQIIKQFHQILVELSIFDESIMNHLNEQLIDYAKSIFTQKEQDLSISQCEFIQQLLSCWKSHGQYNQSLLMVVKQPICVYSKRLNTQELISMAYQIITAQINDIDLIRNLVAKFELLKFQDLKGNELNVHLFYNKLIHLFFRTIQLRDPQCDLTKCTDLIRYLNGYCLAHQQQIKPNLQQQEMSTSCQLSQEKQIEMIDFTKTETQKYKKAQVEKIIVDLIIKHFMDLVQIHEIIKVSKEEQLRFDIDYKHCLFEIDLALFIGSTDKVAIEICGAFYGFDSGGLIGKKNNKFQLLKGDGWKLIIVKTQDQQRILPFQNGRKLVELAHSILEEVEDLIGRKLRLNTNLKPSNVFMTRKKIE